MPLKKQAVDQNVNKAEKQLNKDLDSMMAILAGIPPRQIRFRAVACFPETNQEEFQTNICAECLSANVVCQADLTDLSQLQKKTQVPDKPDPATTSSKHHLLTVSARCLSHQSQVANNLLESVSHTCEDSSLKRQAMGLYWLSAQ